MKSTTKNIALLACMLAASQNTLSAPARCTSGYQDSTCPPALSAAPQTAPTCSTAPGWTTLSAAKWQGAYYSAPQCNYQAPPSCADGYAQTGPDWNGTAWVNLICTPSTPQIPDVGTVCSANLPAGWTVSGPYSGSVSATPPAGYQIAWYSGSTSVLTDKCGATYTESILECWTKTGSNDFYKWAYYTTHASGNCGH